ncbi:16681_t:CDS:2 [Funneliformis caledonium]|uniref:16681_t:CDS:1 n=1 Tax=Funneliformis caledonium TaxID=1117310 RepID=A0A9N9D275_9GLOM|nr:16681_t:CDS:2 [Funneliformis caledonium]
MSLGKGTCIIIQSGRCGHKSEKFLDGICRMKVLKCDLGGRYTQKLSRPTLDKMRIKGSKKQGAFTQNIMEQIEYYVIHGRCNALIIKNLLQLKGISLGDAASLLLKLLDLQSNDLTWFVKPLLDEISNCLIGVFWISPEQLSITEASTSDDNLFKPIFDREDSAETFTEVDKNREMDLQSLMAIVNINDIIKIWKISRYNHPKTY